MRPPFLAIVLLLVGFDCMAHDARPLYITIVEQSQDVFRTMVRIPPTVAASDAPEITWPRECEVLDADLTGATTHLACREGIAGMQITISYPLFNPSLSTLIRLEHLSGLSVTAVLPPDEQHWTVPAEPTFASVAWDYTQLGFSHIWEGPDHLLFVAGLLLLAMSPRKIFWAVTGFTAAHSITLSLAALGFVRVPIAPTEAMIALSILFLAAEIARREADSFSRRFPIVLSFGFGLLHGFGFASALGEIGLPSNELLAGLLFFNVGVELGQLALIAAAIAALMALRLARSAIAVAPQPAERLVTLGGAYGLGVPAALWFIERSVSALAG
jgi:hydrogenase/urease accessory protein HupE